MYNIPQILGPNNRAYGEEKFLFLFNIHLWVPRFVADSNAKRIFQQDRNLSLLKNLNVVLILLRMHWYEDFSINIPMQRGKFENFFQNSLCTRKNSVLKFLTRTEGEGRKFQNWIFSWWRGSFWMKLSEVDLFNFK